MPLHKAEPYCLKSEKKFTPTSDMCSCQHCTLAVCRVCGAYEGGLTTDCPGVRVSADVQDLISKGLDYTDAKGWVLINTKEEQDRREYHFEPTAKQIIERVSKLNGHNTDDIAALRRDAQYWLNNREHRR